MGLLAKTNPAATRESVIRNVTIFGILTAIAYPIAAVWTPGLRDHWLILFPVAVIFGAALGGLLEWQDIDISPIDEVVKDAEEEFGVTIEDDRIAAIESVGDLFEAVLAASDAQRPSRYAADSNLRETVWNRLKRLVVRELGVDETKWFHPHVSTTNYDEERP
jgi:hypothetical protein